jgi:hypothetical protein
MSVEKEKEMTDAEWTEEMFNASFETMNAPWRTYVVFDEIEDVLSSLELLTVITPLVLHQPLLWKWMIVGAQSALQGAMVCALQDTTRTSVLKKKSAAAMLTYLQDRVEGAEMPKEWLEDFEPLLKKCEGQLGLTLGARERKDILLLHSEFRNSFIHFTPKGWSIEKVGLPRIVKAALSLERQIEEQSARLVREKAEAAVLLATMKAELKKAHAGIVATDDLTLLQEVGIYQYRHPLSEVVHYEKELASIEAQIKAMTKKDGGAVLASTDWQVNGSKSEGRTMVRDFSKLLLRAFNAEVDTLVRGLKPYKLEAACDRLEKSADIIQRLSKTMNIRISKEYLRIRKYELELTADYLAKVAEARELEREEREKMREERKAQQEIERERARLEKERQHYENAHAASVANGDLDGASRISEQLAEVGQALNSVDFRAANIRAGYVYVISNIGSFGESLIKVGMTRRLDPMDRIKELSDASVPFNFDVHTLFFSKDAVSIETEIHQRLASKRVNLVNRKREFFRATPLDVKELLAELSGEVVEFQEVAEALEYRQGLSETRQAA